jgi:predicted nucleotidyltransferase
VVEDAARRWAQGLREREPGVAAVGYFGSYALGNWGVGSDLDVVVVVRGAAESFERRAARFDATGLPVPADLLVYTVEEWERLRRRPEPVVWVSGGPDLIGGPR